MGPALGISGLVGTAIATWRLVRGRPREREAILLLAWTLLNLAYFGGQFAKYLRYLLPAYFAIAILAAYALLQGTDWLARVLARAAQRQTIVPVFGGQGRPAGRFAYIQSDA